MESRKIQMEKKEFVGPKNVIFVKLKKNIYIYIYFTFQHRISQGPIVNDILIH